MAVHLFRLRRLAVHAAPRRAGGPPMLGLVPLPAPPALTLTGTTRDSAGVALPACAVELYRRNEDQTQGVFVDRTVSDGSGNFSFVVGPGQAYQYIAYLAGAPDVAGVSVRDLAGV